MTINLDKCFQTFPEVPKIKTHNKYWKDTVTKVRKTRHNSKSKILLKKSFSRETKIKITFNSIDQTEIEGLLSEMEG